MVMLLEGRHLQFFVDKKLDPSSLSLILFLLLQVNTVPQGVIDMNTCTDVYDAENVTGHQFSIAVITPETFTYIKGNGKEEINRYSTKCCL